MATNILPLKAFPLEHSLEYKCADTQTQSIWLNNFEPQVGLPALESTSGKFPSNGSLLSQVLRSSFNLRQSILTLGLFEREKSKWEIGLLQQYHIDTPPQDPLFL